MTRLALLLLAMLPAVASAQQAPPPPRPVTPPRAPAPQPPTPARKPALPPEPRGAVAAPDIWIPEVWIPEVSFDREIAAQALTAQVQGRMAAELAHQQAIVVDAQARALADISHQQAMAVQLAGQHAQTLAIHEYNATAAHGIYPSGGVVSMSGLSTSPRAPWAQDDPADSLYRVAREALNRGEYRRAADLFRNIPARYTNSRYAADALYWQAFSLYRIGGTDDLRTARTVLESQAARYSTTRTQADAATLATRILGALASRGDASAQQALRSRSAPDGAATCDQEDQSVRGEALSAVVRSDPDQALSTLRTVLQRHDVCSAPLRMRAVTLLGAMKGSAQAELMTSVVRNDPSPEVRSSAMTWLVRMPGDQNVALLEDLLRTSNDEKTQAAAVRALATSDVPRARQAVRAVIEREDASRTVRRDAISSYTTRERATPEDGAYLRSLYPRLSDAQLKSAAANLIARLGGPENERWLAGIAQNASEPMDARNTALRAVSSGQVSVGTIVQLYDALSERQLRETLIRTLGRRTEPEATDKLLDIARTGTDPNLRRVAISVVSSKNDPRTTQRLLEIINK